MSRNIGGFGRLPAPTDARDLEFLMRSAMPQIRAAAPPTPRKRAYTEGARLDQGMKPHCVAFSGLGFMNAAPLMKSDGFETQRVYDECQRVDEWPGENYDGTSVRALMRIMQSRGWISSYTWGSSIDEITAWMNGGFGTIIVGTNWYASMDEVDRAGFMRMPGSVATPIGGHAYRLNWYDKTKGGYLVVNSWGDSWGIVKGTRQTGTAYMSREALARLLRESGEVAGPTQVPLKAVRV